MVKQQFNGKFREYVLICQTWNTVTAYIIVDKLGLGKIWLLL
jgi:hypothetical protein